jgi:glycosyl transferase family 25
VTIPVFYINRDRDTARRLHIEEQLDRLGISASRFPAIEGRNIPDWLRPYYDLTLTPGEVGCSASHLMIYAKIRDNNLGYAVVLEDDAVLEPDFMETVAAAVQIAPPHWDVIRLTLENKSPLQILAQTTPGRSLIRYFKIPAGTAALIVSASGARQLLQPRLVKAAIDVEIRTPWHLDLNVFGIAPPIASTVSVQEMPSTIHIRSLARISGKHTSAPRRFLFNLSTMGLLSYVKARFVRPNPQLLPKLDQSRR